MLSPETDHRVFIVCLYFTILASAVLTAWIAGPKGYNRPLWCLAGLFVPNILLIVLLPNLEKMTDDFKRMRWEFGTDCGPFLGFCVFLLMCCHLLWLFNLLNSDFHDYSPVLSCFG